MQNLKESKVEKEVTFNRILNAPRELVWEVWTQKEHIINWWGPKGFSIPQCTWDPKKGNPIIIHMQAPDGVIYPMDGEFIEIVKPEKLAFKSAALDANNQHLFEILNTVTFTEEAGKTKLTILVQVSNIRPEGKPHLDGMNEGWNLMLDKLETHLRDVPFVIERTFNAPVQLVWKAITNKEDMKQWYFDLKEFRPEPGFTFEFTGITKSKEEKLHLCEVTQVIPNKKLVYSWKYQGHPGISHVSFELFDKGDQTTLKLTHTGLGSFPAVADFQRQNFAEGWTMIIGSNLEKYLHK